jgi:carbonic anhydrase
MTAKAVEITYRYEARGTAAGPRPQTSDAALQRLNDGNRDFAALLDSLDSGTNLVQRIVAVDARDLGLMRSDNLVDTAAPTQRPYAAILGCSDARVPTELIFNEGPNELFVIRVAGNGLGTEVLGSLNYAVEHLGDSLKLVVVLGHSGCGAVTAAVDVFLDPADYLPLATSHSLRNILDRLLVVVQASARRLSDVFGPDVVRLPGYRQALIETAIVTNAALAAYSIQEEIGSRDISGLRAAYGVYLLETRQVWSPGWPISRLASPPCGLAGFVELGNALVKSDRIASLIGVQDV